jgi:putative phosphoesterase
MRVAVIADIHSNLPALEAVLGEVGAMRIYCNGDLTGYNPYPNEVIELVKKHNVICTLGNHDHAVLTGNTAWFNPYAAKALKWTREHLSKENLEFLASLPLFHSSEFYMVHGSPRNYLDEYVTGDYPEEVLKGFFNQSGRDVVCLAHTHVPFVKRLGENLLFNPGSVGQPRDLDARASYAVLDLKQRRVEIKRVKYDIEMVVEAVIDAGLPSILGYRLREGR